MYKKLLLLFIFLSLGLGVFAESEIGREINKNEYPDANDVLPLDNTKAEEEEMENVIIEGGIEKTIDLTLMNCIELALGNNPDINVAFHETLASDTRIRQVWSNYFPTFSWQTGYTKIKQLQLSDALGRNLTFNYYLLGQITLSQMLYDFGVTQNQATIRRLEFENSKQT